MSRGGTEDFPVFLFRIGRFIWRRGPLGKALILGFPVMFLLSSMTQQTGSAHSASGAQPAGYLGTHSAVASFITLAISVLAAYWPMRRLWGYKRFTALLVGGIVFICTSLAASNILRGDQPADVLFVLAFYAVALYLTYDQLKASTDYRGWAGERRVERVLRRWLRREEPAGRLFNDVLLPAGDHTTEIDHLLVCRRGVFVIETKSGRRIHITEDGRWFRSDQEDMATAMRSPLDQNAGHLRAVRTVIGNQPLVPLVVLAHEQVKGFVPEGVVQTGALALALSGYAVGTLDVAQVEQITGQLERTVVTGRAAKKAHIAGIKARHGATG